MSVASRISSSGAGSARFEVSSGRFVTFLLWMRLMSWLLMPTMQLPFRSGLIPFATEG